MTATWTGEDHYAAASRCLEAARAAAHPANYLAAAQVHATLALYRAWSGQTPAALEAIETDPWADQDPAPDAASLAEPEPAA